MRAFVITVVICDFIAAFINFIGLVGAEKLSKRIENAVALAITIGFGAWGSILLMGRN